MTSSPDGALISTSQLGHAYGDIVALHHLDFTVPAGRIGLVGANGAGKSTLIKVLLGILHPTEGTAQVLGIGVADDPRSLVVVAGVAAIVVGIVAYLMSDATMNKLRSLLAKESTEETVPADVETDLEGFVQGAPYEDDRTLVLVRRLH